MRLVALILLFLNSALLYSQEAEFFVKTPTFKFPDAREGDQLEHTFFVTNTGKKPLIISASHVECSCTSVEIPKQPVMPGATAAIKVKFDSEGKSYYQDRIIYLDTNTKKKKEKLRFKVYVAPK
ncbi:MAG: hypothetical protein RIT43_2068 [Bacteroidota bacterium]|jgi:hypothetical protein